MSKIDLRTTGDLLLAAQDLVLCCHVSPDGDTLGSALGLKLFLESQGKRVRLLVDDKIDKGFGFLPGSETIIRPQAGESYPTDLLVVIDASSWDRIGITADVVQPQHIMNIDHHISNTEFAEYLYLDPQAAAVGEVMCDLFLEMGWSYTPEIALNFYTAMSTDSGSFRYTNTTSKTMRRAGDLLDYGVNPTIISDNLDMKSRATAELFSKVLPTLTFEEEGRLAYISLSNALYDENVSTEPFVYYPRYTEGVDVAVFFKAVEPEVTRVSMRSSKTDVAAIALSFGGGGHIRAAGCTINAPLEKAREQLLAALRKVM